MPHQASPRALKLAHKLRFLAASLEILNFQLCMFWRSQMFCAMSRRFNEAGKIVFCIFSIKWTFVVSWKCQVKIHSINWRCFEWCFFLTMLWDFHFCFCLYQRDNKKSGCAMLRCVSRTAIVNWFFMIFMFALWSSDMTQNLVLRLNIFAFHCKAQ